MSENAVDVNSMGQAQGDVDVDWDDIPTNEFDEAPAEEAGSEENNEENTEASVTELEDFDSELPSKEARGEDSKSEEPTSDSKEEAPSGEKEGDSENTEEELVEVKIDGELQKVSLQELKNNYSGKVAYDKKFSELDQERKQVVSERDSLQNDINAVNQYVAELGDKMRNVSMMEGLYEIAALNNIGPHMVKQALIAEILPEINRMAELSEDQIQLEYNKSDLEYQKSLQQREQERFRSEQTQRELNDKVNSVLDANKIEMSEYKEAEAFLNARKDQIGEVTPELVGEYVTFSRAENRAENLLNQFDSGKHFENEEVMNGVIDMLLQNPEFSDADVNEILTDVLGQAKREVAEQKIEQKQQKQTKSTKKTVQLNNTEVEEGPTDWEDILD